MPKFKPLKEENFVKKISWAIFILIAVVSSGTIMLASENKSYNESLLKTIELITHVQLHNQHNQIAFLMVSLLGYVTQFYILYVILEFVLEGKFRSIFTEVKTLKMVNKMKNHFIICGGGRVGQHVADELIKFKKSYVILEANEQRFKELKRKSYIVINADALDEKELEKANITNASFLIAALGDDGDNILLVLTAKELNPALQIASRANSEKIVRKLKHAGARHIVLPEVLGGMQLARLALRDDLGFEANS